MAINHYDLLTVIDFDTIIALGDSVIYHCILSEIAFLKKIKKQASNLKLA
ncbi:hypothetical protein K9M79_03895 [Candidatus Woesearchaeota archaeon]|nr:hypothetical protein [Candidatus Woesearchaeota archaeon]